MEKVELERKCWTRLKRSWTLSRTEVWGHWLPEILPVPLALNKASSIEALLWVPQAQTVSNQSWLVFISSLLSDPLCILTIIGRVHTQENPLEKRLKYSTIHSPSLSPTLSHPGTHTPHSVGDWTQSKCSVTELQASSKWPQCATFTWSKALYYSGFDFDDSWNPLSKHAGAVSLSHRDDPLVLRTTTPTSTSLHSYQQWLRVPFVPLPAPYLLS